MNIGLEFTLIKSMNDKALFLEFLDLFMPPKVTESWFAPGYPSDCTYHYTEKNCIDDLLQRLKSIDYPTKERFRAGCCHGQEWTAGIRYWNSRGREFATVWTSFSLDTWNCRKKEFLEKSDCFMTHQEAVMGHVYGDPQNVLTEQDAVEIGAYWALWFGTWMTQHFLTDARMGYLQNHSVYDCHIDGDVVRCIANVCPEDYMSGTYEQIQRDFMRKMQFGELLEYINQHCDYRSIGGSDISSLMQAAMEVRLGEVYTVGERIPFGFGYKTIWIAAKCYDQSSLEHAIGLENMQLYSWEDGMAACAGHSGQIAVAGDFHGYYLAVGDSLIDIGVGKKGLDWLRKVGKRLSEVNYFISNRVVDCYGFAQIKSGRVLRAYYYTADQGILLNKGKPLKAEMELGIDLSKDGVSLDEHLLLELAGKLCINPINLTKYAYTEMNVGNISKEYKSWGLNT